MLAVCNGIYIVSSKRSAILRLVAKLTATKRILKMFITQRNILLTYQTELILLTFNSEMCVCNYKIIQTYIKSEELI